MRAVATSGFILVLAIATTAAAGPANSTIGAKKLEEDMVHSGGVGYPSILYEWWNKGKKSLDWGLSGELVYGDWGSFTTSGTRNVFGFRVRFDLIRIGFGVSGMLRWHLAEKQKPRVTNDVAFLFKPGVLIAGNTGRRFTFGIKPEVAAPFTIDVHERVTVVTGGYIPLTFYINKDTANWVVVPFLIRLGIEIDAGEKVAPWFYFDMGGAVVAVTRFEGFPGDTRGAFAWRLGAGTAFWGVLGKSKHKSDAAGSTGDGGTASGDTD